MDEFTHCTTDLVLEKMMLVEEREEKAVPMKLLLSGMPNIAIATGVAHNHMKLITKKILLFSAREQILRAHRS